VTVGFRNQACLNLGYRSSFKVSKLKVPSLVGITIGTSPNKCPLFKIELELELAVLPCFDDVDKFKFSS
jgi:hypothetical protein